MNLNEIPGSPFTTDKVLPRPGGGGGGGGCGPNNDYGYTHICGLHAAHYAVEQLSGSRDVISATREMDLQLDNRSCSEVTLQQQQQQHQQQHLQQEPLYKHYDRTGITVEYRLDCRQQQQQQHPLDRPPCCHEIEKKKSEDSDERFWQAASV